MASPVRLACAPRIVSLPLNSILPVKTLNPGISKTAKYCRIVASIQEVGIIEPLLVYPQAAGGAESWSVLG